MNRRGASGARLLAVAVLLVSSAGCARLFGSYDLAPNGLASSEDRLRHMLATGRADVAFAGFGSAHKAPDDEVLRALYQGVIAYYAGDYAESARVLDIAGDLADDRITKSISRSALSVISNDLILPYEPARTERLMIPYYAALARLRLGDVEGAAVEARRLSMLLQLYGDDAERLDPAFEATLRYLAGAIFEAHGDRNDSDVAYRNALTLDSTLIAPATHERGDARGTVIVVLEQGFVAHRVEQGLSVMLLPEEMDLIANGEGDEKSDALGFVAARTLLEAARAPFTFEGNHRPAALYVPAPEDRSHIPRRRPRTVCREVADTSHHGTNGTTIESRRECREEKVEVDELPYLLKVAWPVYRSEYRALDARLTIAADTLAFSRGANVSTGVIADFQAERALVIARTVARGAAKLALTKGAEKKLEEKNEAAGRLIGLLGNLGNVLLERADTRSWHLLPAGISVARVRLPAGEHALHVEAGPRTIELPVTVTPGSLTVVSTRTW